jgi:hypothetical protein
LSCAVGRHQNTPWNWRRGDEEKKAKGLGGDFMAASVVAQAQGFLLSLLRTCHLPGLRYLQLTSMLRGLLSRQSNVEKELSEEIPLGGLCESPAFLLLLAPGVVSDFGKRLKHVIFA